MAKVKQIKVKALASRVSVTRKDRPVKRAAIDATKAKGSAGRSTGTGTRQPSVSAAKKPKTPAGPRGVAKGRKSVPGAVKAAGRPAANGKANARPATGSRKGTRNTAEALREVRVRELVPEKVCGPRTRVQQVFRVEARVNGSSQTHLVFNDHHGWYCEHGTDCPAVGAVRKSGKSEAARSSAWTTNGRMRE